MNAALRVVCCAVAVASASFAPGSTEHRLQLVGANSGVREFSIRRGEAFDISFVHSQEKARWAQHYRVGTDDAIVQTGSTFDSYGAGMPLEPVRLSAAGFTAPLGRRLGVIRMLNSRDAQLTLHYRGVQYTIGQWFAPFEQFDVRVR